MRLLAIDTSTDACSIALDVDADIRERHEIAPRRHGELVLPLVDELMAEAGLEVAQLDAVVLGRGPGSFTGLRIAAGVVQGIAFAADLPVACVSSLAILAQGAAQEVDADHLICAQDARMGEVYAGVFERVDGLVNAVAPEQVCPAEAVLVPAGFRGLGVGSGFEGYGETLRARLGDSLQRTDSGHRYPRARDALELGRVVLEAGGGVGAAQALPVYLRDEVTHRGGGQ